jgi:hypothetical protein
MSDIMLDLETWGTRPGCAIRAIGACVFDPNGNGTGAEFYINVSDDSCKAAGLTQDPNTVEWWSRQSKDAQQALLIDQMPLKDALWSFASWFQTMGGERIWSHGANFDQPILEAAFVACDFVGAPWSFWNSRCSRTLLDIAQVDTRAGASGRKGTHHKAIDDAKFQALCVQAGIKRLFKPNFAAQTGDVFA